MFYNCQDSGMICPFLPYFLLCLFFFVSAHFSTLVFVLFPFFFSLFDF